MAWLTTLLSSGIKMLLDVSPLAQTSLCWFSQLQPQCFSTPNLHINSKRCTVLCGRVSPGTQDSSFQLKIGTFTISTIYKINIITKKKHSVFSLACFHQSNIYICFKFLVTSFCSYINTHVAPLFLSYSLSSRKHAFQTHLKMYHLFHLGWEPRNRWQIYYKTASRTFSFTRQQLSST